MQIGIQNKIHHMHKYVWTHNYRSSLFSSLLEIFGVGVLWPSPQHDLSVSYFCLNSNTTNGASISPFSFPPPSSVAGCKLLFKNKITRCNFVLIASHLGSLETCSLRIVPVVHCHFYWGALAPLEMIPSIFTLSSISCVLLRIWYFADKLKSYCL